MAKNKYRVYTFESTYECGHEGKIKQGGYTEEYAKGLAGDEFKGLCPECTEKKRAEDSVKHASQAQEMGLPALVGSPKQVAWAETIRANIIEVGEDMVDEVQEDTSTLFGPSYGKETIREALNHMLLTETSAVVYIDNRNAANNNWFFVSFVSKYIVGKETPEEQGIKTAIEKENTMVPEDFSDVIATVSEREYFISITSIKDEKLNAIVKDLGYRWGDNTWRKSINKFSGPMQDRIAEVGHALLSSGYGIVLNTHNPEEIKTRITNADFEQEQTNWLKQKGDRLFFTWQGYSDEKYTKTKSIKGARWRNGGMEVPVESYNAALDFADINGFSVSDAALELIKTYKEQLEAVERVSVIPKNTPTEKDKLAKILNSATEVPEDLRDD